MISLPNSARLTFFGFIIAFLSGCAVGPDYRTPLIETASTWHAETATGVKKDATEPIQLSQWWSRLDDPLLSRLIEEILSQNLDLKQAYARLRESRVRRGYSEADRFPTVKTGAGASRTSTSAELGAGNRWTSDTYSGQFDVNWELDLFGGRKRALEAASANVDASTENVRDVQVSMMAEVALTYIEIRTCQSQINNTRATIVSLEESAQMANWRNQAGLVSQLDVEQSQVNLEQTRAQMPILLNRLEQAKNNLAFLLNRQDSRVPEMNQEKPVPVSRTEIAVGVPAEMLRRRPDVRRTERQLAAATAQIGEAEAARYPSLSLSGTIGLQASSPGYLFHPGAFAYTLASNAVMTVFDGGRLKQKVEIQNALQEQALITYQSAVRGAVRDVENALVAYAEEQNRCRILKSAVKSAQNAANLATNQYTVGLIDYSTVVESQKSLLSNQYQLIQSEAAVTSNLIRLYKALGGGWGPAAREPEAHHTTSPGDTQ